MSSPEGSPLASPPSLPPSGTVCFLFTDIEGSTARWERSTAAMSDALARHDALLRAAFHASGGFVFKTGGDSFCCAFSSVAGAIAAATSAQHALGAEDFSAVGGLPVRIALHVGSADERDGDYFGPAVNRVARLLAVTHGGQVVLSEASAALAQSALPPGGRFVDLGNHRLKDLTLPERVFQLAFDDLPSEFPPLRSLNVLDNNLPLQLTALVGRTDELQEVEHLTSRHRLVTLVGTGGVGKTRVALQAAANLLDGYVDGAWFVDLAHFREPSFVASAVAASVGAPLSADGDVLRAVARFLKFRRVLLIFDNCEHVIDEAARVIGTILDACAGVHVLATSREVLKVGGERVYRMPSLEVPPPGECDPAKILAYPACVLFVQRAASSGFACTPADAFAIAEICRRLDGIPLAIELAAPRTRVLSPASIVKRLDERFRVLSGGPRGVLPRQQTMRALIDWSYDLLGGHEQRLFRRCAVFAGGWTIRGAEAVAGADDRRDTDAFELLSALVDKSLVGADVISETTSSRFTFLESIRLYAFEKLLESGEREDVFEAHARWVAATFEDARGLEPMQRWLAEMSPEVDNVRVALGWSLGAGDDPVLAGRIAGDARHLWYEAGLQADGRRFIEAALARIDADREPATALHLWHVLAGLRFANGTIQAARQALEIAERMDAHPATADALVQLGFGLWQAGRSEEAELELQRALALHRALGTTRSEGHASACDALANVVAGLGRNDEARDHFAEALEIFKSRGDRLGAALVQGNFAELEFVSGHPERALERLAESIVVFRELRATVREATALVNQAAYLLSMRSVEEARTVASQALELGRRVHDAQIVAVALQHVATVAALAGEAVPAARLIGYVDAWYRNEGYERERNERSSREVLVRALREHLAEEDTARFAAAGANLTEGDAIREAESLLRKGGRALHL